LKKPLLLCFLFILLSKVGYTQSTINIDSLEKSHPPGRAAFKSAILPGFGQAYNKKYWKIPIIYAGLGTLTYFAIYNNSQYQNFKTAYIASLDGDSAAIDPAYAGYSTSDLQTQENYWHRNRDLCIIGASLLYVLNILDAYVDAHLFYFKMTENITMRVIPEASYTASKPYTGIHLNFTF
jgi:hypothetical protein